MSRPVLSDADRSDVFRGLAHPARRRMLRVLGKGEATAGQLGTGLKMSTSAVSQHLRVLREVGLITYRPAGAQRYYRRNESALRRAKRWLDQIG